MPDGQDIAAGTNFDGNADGVPDDCQSQLVQLLGVGVASTVGSPDTLISPLGENTPLTRFTLKASEALTLASARSLYTGPVGGGRRGSGNQGGIRRTPEVVGFTNQGNGLHLVELDLAPAPGQWLKLSLDVRGQSTLAPSSLDVWLAHHPGDVNQDGTVDVRDATAFGDLFGNSGSPLLVDLNGDGQVDARDATTFGDLWHGRNGVSQPWNGHRLPVRPE